MGMLLGDDSLKLKIMFDIFSSHRRALETAFSQRDGAQAQAQDEQAEEESLCFVSVH